LRQLRGDARRTNSPQTHQKDKLTTNSPTERACWRVIGGDFLTRLLRTLSPVWLGVVHPTEREPRCVDRDRGCPCDGTRGWRYRKGVEDSTLNHR
jgi:hypothetical protein